MSPVGDNDELTYVEVRRRGEVIANGLGDDLVDALLDLLPHMLPPDHPEYPTEKQ